MKDQIKICVQDENLFGYVYPENTDSLSIISALHTKGAHNNSGTSVLINDSLRLANESDFDTFRIHRSQYDRVCPVYDYIFNKGI